MTDIESAPLTRLWFEAPFEDHLSTGKDTVAKQSLRAKITDVQWNVERLFQPLSGVVAIRRLHSEPFGYERNGNFRQQTHSSRFADHPATTGWWRAATSTPVLT
jgi:hypothetical protein